MWVFTQRGFVSVVEYDPKVDKHAGSPFKGLTNRRGSHVLVRSRVRNDLEDVRRVVPNMRIYDDNSADYKYRAVIKRKDFNKWLTLSADEIDYDSHFKEAAQKNSKGATGRYSAYMGVWGILNRLQTSPVFNPASNPKPLIGPGAQYEDVNDYLTESGFKARMEAKKPKPYEAKPWTPYGKPLEAATPAFDLSEDEEGSLTVADLTEALRDTPLEMLSEAVISDLNDEAWDVWCYLDEAAMRGDIDPLKPIGAELDTWVEEGKAWSALPDEGERAEVTEALDALAEVD
jgi:hypothetical protein